MTFNRAVVTYLKYHEFPVLVQKTAHSEFWAVHRHEDFSELVVVLKGIGRLIAGAGEYLIKKGDVLVINSGVMHGVKDACELEICSIRYEVEKIINWAGALREIPGFRLFVEGSFGGDKREFKGGLHLDAPGLEHVEWLVDRIIYEYGRMSEDYAGAVKAYFLAAAAYISRQDGNIGQNATPGDFQLGNIIEYIKEHFTEPLKVNQLAKMTHLSPRHFTRVFKEYFQTTPMTYIINHRLQYARSLLAREDYSITQVANESGFSDSNYFTRQFRKAYGVSPSKYRLGLEQIKGRKLSSIAGS